MELKKLTLALCLFTSPLFALDFGDIPADTDVTTLWIAPARTLTIAGTTFNLSADRSWPLDTITGVSSNGFLTRTGANTLTNTTAPTGAVVGTTDTQTLTNKRINPRVTTITSSATPTINTDIADCVTITALATDITSMTSGLSGTPVNFQKIIIRIKDNASPRAIIWGASFVSSQATLPTTTVTSKVTTVGLMWDSVKTKWVCLATDQEP